MISSALALESSRSAGVSTLAGSLGQLSKDWKTFFAEWLRPATDLLVPTLAVLVFLIVVARLATPLVAHPNDRAWGTTATAGMALRRAVWGTGLASLCASAATPVLVSSGLGQGSRGSVIVAWLAISVFGAMLVAVSWKKATGERRFWLGDPAAFRRWSRVPALVMVVSGIIGIVLAFLNVEWAREWPLICWVAAAGLALVGIVWVAAGRGHDLALRVEVLDEAGTGNAGDAQYLIGRLHALGSERPLGLRVPRETDVTALPEDALTSLPTGTVAKALLQAARAVLPAVPWQVTVAVRDDETMVVSMSRNGKGAGDAIIISRRQLLLPNPPPPSATGTIDKADKDDYAARTQAALLSAAAAAVLIALSDRHVWLKTGLCGACRWESVAAHVIATDTSYVSDEKNQRRILLGGLDADADNALARVALVTTAATSANDWEKQREIGAGLLHLQHKISDLGLAYEKGTRKPLLEAGGKDSAERIGTVAQPL
jgi:hypothetical protein